MPRLSCWFIRAALIYLAAGFSLGALMLANKGLSFSALLWRFLPVHTELLLMGWLVQLALGMAFWILPRFQHGAPRGNEALAWLAFVSINLGISLVVAETVSGVHELAYVGRMAEIVGIFGFVLGSWRRVRPFI